jgi:hypothetical protein
MRTTMRYSLHMRRMICPTGLNWPSWRVMSRSMFWNSGFTALESNDSGRFR